MQGCFNTWKYSRNALWHCCSVGWLLYLSARGQGRRKRVCNKIWAGRGPVRHSRRKTAQQPPPATSTKSWEARYRVSLFSSRPRSCTSSWHDSISTVWLEKREAASRTPLPISHQTNWDPFAINYPPAVAGWGIPALGVTTGLQNLHQQSLWH